MRLKDSFVQQHGGVAMSFADQLLAHDRPNSIRQDVELPNRQSYFASSADWRN